MWQSVILWPDSVSTGVVPNESTDLHRDQASAKAVCRGVEREGLGGEGKVFPLSTRVEWVAKDVGK